MNRNHESIRPDKGIKCTKRSSAIDKAKAYCVKIKNSFVKRITKEIIDYYLEWGIEKITDYYLEWGIEDVVLNFFQNFQIEYVVNAFHLFINSIN